MRLLKDYRSIDQEKKSVKFTPDTSVKVRKKSSNTNLHNTVSSGVSDDTEREVLSRIREIYKKDLVRFDLDDRKSPDFVVDRIYEECSKRGRKTNFISIDRSSDKMGFRVTLKHRLGDKESIAVSKAAMKLKVALLLTLEAIIS